MRFFPRATWQACPGSFELPLTAENELLAADGIGTGLEKGRGERGDPGLGKEGGRKSCSITIARGVSPGLPGEGCQGVGSAS